MQALFQGNKKGAREQVGRRVRESVLEQLFIINFNGKNMCLLFFFFL